MSKSVPIDVEMSLSLCIKTCYSAGSKMSSLTGVSIIYGRIIVVKQLIFLQGGGLKSGRFCDAALVKNHDTDSS